MEAIICLIITIALIHKLVQQFALWVTAILRLGFQLVILVVIYCLMVYATG